MRTPEKRSRPLQGRPAESAATPTPKRYINGWPDASAEVEDLLASAREFQGAARRVADDQTLSVKARCLALLDLGRRARRETPGGFAASAVWGGARHFLAEDGLPAGGDGTVNAIRRLRYDGHSDCPSCKRPLPDHEELDGWNRLRHASYYRGPA